MRGGDFVIPSADLRGCQMRHLIIGTFALLALTGCEKHDDNFMPYDLKGMNVYVYDEDDNEHFAGFAQGSYSQRGDVLSACQSNANGKAHELHIDDSDWSYICCTVTSDSSCATKVR